MADAGHAVRFASGAGVTDRIGRAGFAEIAAMPTPAEVVGEIEAFPSAWRPTPGRPNVR